MERLIKLHLVQGSRMYEKTIGVQQLEELIGEEGELLSTIEPTSEIEYIYINFDRNKNKKRSMWIKYLQNDGEKNIDIEQYRLFYKNINKLCCE